MAGLREAVDFLSDALVENLADVTVDLMPDRQIAELGLIDTVQSLSAIAEENAASTQETSASMMEIGSVINDISQNAENLKNIAEVLEKNVQLFQMEES